MGINKICPETSGYDRYGAALSAGVRYFFCINATLEQMPEMETPMLIISTRYEERVLRTSVSW